MTSVYTMTPEAMKIVDEMQAQDLAEKEAANLAKPDNREEQ